MSAGRNGRGAAIVAYVAAHPGCSSASIFAAVGMSDTSGLLSYCVSTGRVFKAGRHVFSRYFPTRELAEASHAALIAAADRKVGEARRRHERDSNVRKRAARHAEGCRPITTRSDCIVMLAPDVRLAAGVRITTAKAAPGRYEVTEPFVGQITRDWLAASA